MKRFLKLYLLLFIFVSSLYANVTVIAPDYFIDKEGYRFEIEATGKDVDIPDIKKIDNYSVRNLGTSRSMSNINGNIVNKLKKSFYLTPKKDFILPEFSINIDGKTYKTKSKSIKLSYPQKSKSNNFNFDIRLQNNDLYVGQSSVLKLIFKYRKDLKIVDLNFQMPLLNHIWIKKTDNQKSYQDGEFLVQELDYIVFPQKSGKLRIPPIKIEATTIDAKRYSYSLFSTPTKVEKVYSNSIDFEAKPLAENINIFGEFIVKSEISNDTLKEGEALSYKIIIDGFGNIDDIKDFKLDIPRATVYEDKPEITTKIENGKYKGRYSKSFSIVSSEDFVIPAIEFKYFDSNIKKVVTQRTNEYKIKVEQSSKNKFSGLEKKEQKSVEVKEKIVYKKSLEDRVVFFVLGLLVSILIIGLYIYVKNRESKDKRVDKPLSKKVKSSKHIDEILKYLVPYLTQDKQLDDIIFKLDDKKEIDIKKIKKEILEVLKRLGL